MLSVDKVIRRQFNCIIQALKIINSYFNKIFMQELKTLFMMNNYNQQIIIIT